MISGYNETGLFGLTASADGSKAEDMVNVMVAELQAVASKGAISDIELSRAKNVCQVLPTYLSFPKYQYALSCEEMPLL